MRFNVSFLVRSALPYPCLFSFPSSHSECVVFVAWLDCAWCLVGFLPYSTAADPFRPYVVSFGCRFIVVILCWFFPFYRFNLQAYTTDKIYTDIQLYMYTCICMGECVYVCVCVCSTSFVLFCARFVFYSSLGFEIYSL